MLRRGLLPCILHTLLRRGLLRYRLHTCPKLWCNPCSKCYGMGCLAAFFTHVQSCDVTRVQSATRWTASVQTSHQDVTQYRGRLFTGRHVTSGRHMEELRGQGASRHVMSRHVRTSQAPPWTRRPSRHVTSGRHRRQRGQGGRHVTSRPVRTSQAPPWTRMPSRHVTSGNEAPLWTRRPSRHVVSGCQAPPSTRRPSRHVTSHHVTTSGAPRADHAQIV